MLILREIDYSRKSEIELDEEIKFGAETFIREILKYILMSRSPLVGEWTRKHWVIGASNKMIQVGPDRAIKLFLGLVDDYRSLPRKRYTWDFVLELRKNNQTASEYLNQIIDSIRNDKSVDREFKYTEALKTGGVDGVYSTEDIIQMCKFIALCLTHQLDPHLDNWYDNKVVVTKVNWDSHINISSNNLRTILKSITGGI